MTAPLTVNDLRGQPRRRRKEATVRALFLTAAALSLVITTAIIAVLVIDSYRFLDIVGFSSLIGNQWNPRSGFYDVRTIIVGTLQVAAVAIVVATPLSLGAAVYLSEYAPNSVRRVVKPAIEVLAGIPSVVLAFFTLNFLSPNIVQTLFGGDTPKANILAAGLGVGVLIIPLITSVTEDALRSVPDSLREASVGVGAKKVTTTVRVVLPAALSGIVAAMILGISRAIGETLVVTLAAGATSFARWPGAEGAANLLYGSYLDQGLTMTGAMANLINRGDTPIEPGAKESLYFIGFVLFAITLTLNLLADRLVRRFQNRY